MTRALTFLATLITLPLLTLLGCSTTNDSGTLIEAFEDLTTSSTFDADGDVTLLKVMSLSGMLPHTTPGTLLYHDGSPSPSSVFGLSNETSYVETRTIPSPDDPKQKLVKIRDGLIKVGSTQRRLLRIKLAVATGDATHSISELTEAHNAYDNAVRDAQLAVDEPGLLVTRWNVKSKREYETKFGDIFGFEQTSEREIGGFLLLAGIRANTLFLGPDIATLWYASKNHVPSWETPATRPPGHWSDFFITQWGYLSFPYLYIKQLAVGDLLPPAMIPPINFAAIVTSTVQCQYAVYVQDSSDSTAWATRLTIELDRVTDKAKRDALTQLAIEASFMFNEVRNLGNAGFIGEVAITRNPVRPAELWSPTESAKDDEKWHTLMATEAELPSLAKQLSQ